MNAPSWNRFEPGGPLHLAVLAVFLLATGLAVALGLALGERRRRPLERAFGAATVAAWFGVSVWWLTPGMYDRDWSWPLHVCDLAALAAGCALLVPADGRRFARVATYYFGFGLCTQAFVTPLLRLGPSTLEFWIFWLDHAVICGVGLYELLVRRFRPTWRDWRIAVATGAAYLAVVFPLDAAFDLNYGFVGRWQARGTLLEWLGPWPWRVGVIAAGTALAFALLTLPWTWPRRRPAPEPAA